jgi:hypothetical protein
MRHNGKRMGVLMAAFAFVVLGLAKEARADDATVAVGFPPDPPTQPVVVASSGHAVADDDFIAREPELRRSPFRMALGPAGVTTGKGFGFGVGIGADFGTGSVGGRLAAAWLRGEGKNSDGTSTRPETPSDNTRARSRSIFTNMAPSIPSSAWGRAYCT